MSDVVKKMKEEKRKANRLAHKAGQVKAREPIATPVGTKQRMLEFRHRLLKAETGEAVIRKVLEIAADDSHAGQIAALKMCMDRMLPVSFFEDKKESGSPVVQITISGMDREVKGEVIDGGA